MRTFALALLLATSSVVTPAWGETPAPAPALTLQKNLSSLERDRLFRAAKVGVQLVDVQTGEEVYSFGPDVPLNPASTMKIITAAVALKKLGPHYRFRTGFYSKGDISSSGTLDDNLYVKGGGDPTLVIEKLWKLVIDLKMKGIKKIDGNIIFDDSFHEGEVFIPGWNKAIDLSVGPSYYSALSALSLNFNTAALVIGPGSGAGKLARVQLETAASDAVEIKSEVKTGARGTKLWLDVKRTLSDGKTVFKIKGNVPSNGSTSKYYRTVGNPTDQFMGVFRELLKKEGVEVTGSFRKGKLDKDAELVESIRSRPLSVVLMDQNKFSNNFYAEQVLRTVAAETTGIGSTEKGIEVAKDYLLDIGVEADTFNLVNGSGLSRQATVAPSVFTAVLVDMAHDSKVGREFASSLAIAGWDGTLWRRFPESPASLRGKTGTIDGVHCLTGYVESAEGREYAFAFLVNDHGGQLQRVKALHDKFARQILELGKTTAER